MKDYHLEQKFFEFHDLKEMLSYCSEKYQDKTAFITKVKDGKNVQYVRTSYRRLLEDMNYLGTGLRALGFEGVPLAVLGDNSYNWCLSYFTIASGVGMTVPLDKALQKGELESCLKRSRAKAVFTTIKSREVACEILGEGSTLVTKIIESDFDKERYEALKEPEYMDAQALALLEENLNVLQKISIYDVMKLGREKLAQGFTDYIDAKIDRTSPSFLLFTSGTTARSKAVLLSHQNLMSCNYGMNCEELFFSDDVNLIILPLHHIYGLSGLITFLSQGLENAFCDGLKYIAKNMEEYGVTIFLSVPLLLENLYKKIQKGIVKSGQEKKIKRALTITRSLLKVKIDVRRKVFKPIIDQLGGRLRFIINGAAALDPKVSKGLNDFGILTVQGYGLTETAPTISSETYRYLKPGSVGIVMPNVEAQIVNPDENGIGELAVRGDNVMVGYHEDPEATAEIIKDGWLYTGDLAYFEDRYLFICGRKKNVIVMKTGKNVFPEELENNINLLPYVEESMVFGKDRGTDVVICAKVVYSKVYLDENNISLEELGKKLEDDMAKINKNMPAYKMIKRYYLSDVPTIKTTTQKTKRNLEMEVIEREMADRNLTV